MGMTAEQIKTLKSKIINEMRRRGGSGGYAKYKASPSFGSLQSLCDTAYNFTTTPKVDEPILIEHGSKTLNILMETLNKNGAFGYEPLIKGKAIPSTFDYDKMSNALTIIRKEMFTGETDNTLRDYHNAGKAYIYSVETSSCNAACSGLCIGSCIGMCNGCNALFSNPKFTGRLTSNVRTEYQSQIEKLKDIEFSIFNILEIKWDILRNVSKGIEQSIIDCFDDFCSSWYCDSMGSTIHYYNGWKTNSAYKINKKAIALINAFSCYSGSFDPLYGVWDGGGVTKLYDLEKCFSYLDSGHVCDGAEISNVLRWAQEVGKTRNIELRYFTVSFYKKGTCHIVFTNEELLKKFNLYGSQKKGWLPPSYGKKAYEEMLEEEQAVINDFEGKEEYQKVLNNKDFYFVDDNSFLLDLNE